MKERFRRFVRVLWIGYLFLRYPRKAYNIVGLIRGPDFRGWCGISLKDFFTQRLRGFFFPPNSIEGSMRNTPPTKPYVYELHQGLTGLAEEVREGKRSSSDIEHYLAHAEHATEVLLNLPLQTKEEKKELRALYELAKLLWRRAPYFDLAEETLLGWYNDHFPQPSVQ